MPGSGERLAYDPAALSAASAIKERDPRVSGTEIS